MNTAACPPTLERYRLQPNSLTDLAIEEACRRIPPLWPLKDFVAVNPFLGMADQDFLQAAACIQRIGHGSIMMPNEYYLKRLHCGDITDEDIAEAVTFARLTLPLPWSAYLKDYSVTSLCQALGAANVHNRQGCTITVSDFADQLRSTRWTAFIIEEISKWCSVYFDEGQSSWRMPWRDMSLYQAWLEATRHDANPRLAGLATFDQIIRALSKCPREAIGTIISVLRIPLGLQADFLHRQLLDVGGWSSYAQYRVRQHAMEDRKSELLMELLAVRMAYDWALWEQFKGEREFEHDWLGRVDAMQQYYPDLELLPRYVALTASEKSYQRRLGARLLNPRLGEPKCLARPILQAIFCIDVRSEVYRRHLEAQHENIRTSGFAGFFGMPIEFISMGQRHGSAQCPVLLSPRFKVQEGPKDGDERTIDSAHRQYLFKQRTNHGWNAFKASAISCFSFVEAAGIAYGYKLSRDALGLNHAVNRRDYYPQLECQKSPHNETACGIPLKDQIDLAEGMLRNLGLTSDFSRLVLLCGHASSTANNPYSSALDCGACGGHSGQVNAQVAARILNQHEVRQALNSRGIEVPDDTHFLAGLHNTTTEEVELFECASLPPSHTSDLGTLRNWLKRATYAAQSERADRLGFDRRTRSLSSKIRARSRDWSEVRPEWGLANNAAFIAAPRRRTRGMNLDGRTFLHDYDASTDPEGKILELILTAPVVVASWINLQYYASTVNNQLFGSGNKTIHNVVGVLGIWHGNGGDLQVGLPLQSLYNGKTLLHEPLRLSVFVQNTREVINQVLSAQIELRTLIQNGWLSLFALDPAVEEISQYIGNFRWRKMAG